MQDLEVVFDPLPSDETQGYELVGTLVDYPPGHCKFFLRKQLPKHGPRDPQGGIPG